MAPDDPSARPTDPAPPLPPSTPSGQLAAVRAPLAAVTTAQHALADLVPELLAIADPRRDPDAAAVNALARVVRGDSAVRKTLLTLAWSMYAAGVARGRESP
jgi:hypothetical protein